MAQEFDCRKLQRIRVSRAACLAMVASAAEVFPKECMGVICSSSSPGRTVALISSAFPYQLARRGKAVVSSDSSYWLLGMMTRKSGPASMRRLGDYHSHPYENSQIDELAPSEYDLENMEIGALEVILRTRRVGNRRNYWRNTSGGSISVAWNKFRFLIRAFVRLDGFDKKQVPNYHGVTLILKD